MIELRAYQRQDAEHFIALFTDGEVSGFVGGPRSVEDSQKLFDSLVDGTHARAVRAYAVTHSGVMVGHAVLFKTDDDDVLELGYMIERASWGKGIGTETARCLLDEARALGAKTCSGTIDTDNHASQRILERLGGVQTVAKDDEGEYFVYRIPLE